MRTCLSELSAAALAAALLAPALTAQTSLGRPEARLPDDFGSIQTVRELPDGRVLVADPLGKALYTVDLDKRTRTVIGTEGQGPEEYRQPDAVWPWPADSTLLVDLGNGRLVVVAPDLAFGRTRPISQGDFQPGQPLVLAIPQGVDDRGAIYFRSMSAGMGGALPDSADILRLPLDGGASQVVARFKVQDRKVSRSGGASNQNVAIEPIPLSPEDAWGVAEDGSVVIARSGDYHVEWVSRDGKVTRGPSVAFDPVRIGTSEKEEWVTESGRSGGGIGVQVQVVNGNPSMSFQRGGGGPKREIDSYTWPERMSAIYGGRIPVDPSGRAWVRRHVEAGEPALYDVFDRSGKRVGSVALDPGKRVIGFGRRGVYVVAFDDVDLNYLERYAMPAL